jgi:hypothetical protein
MPAFPSLLLLVAPIVWSLYMDGLLVRGHLLSALLLAGTFMVSVFITSSRRLERRFLFLWILGLVGLLLFSFAWGGGVIPLWPSSLFFLIFALLELGPVLNAERGRALFLVHFSTLTLFASLVADGHLGYSSWLTVVVYVPIGVFIAVQAVTGKNIQKKIKCKMLLDSLLILAFYILAARKWTGASTILWLLIVQPLVGAIFIDLLVAFMRERGERGEKGRLISSGGVNKNV